MSIRDLATFCSLLQFFSGLYFSFRGHSHPLLCLFMGIWFFFESIINGNVFLYSFSICSFFVYRQTTDFLSWFCIMLLCWGFLWCLGVFVFKFLGLWCTRSCHHQRRVWLLHYLFVLLLCLVPVLQLWLGSPRLCWIVLGRVEHPCLIFHFEENDFCFSPLNMMLAIGFSI
jgi:hypothetical protein